MPVSQPRQWQQITARAVCLLIAAISLTGCIIVPVRPYHPWPRYYYAP